MWEPDYGTLGLYQGSFSESYDFGGVIGPWILNQVHTLCLLFFFSFAGLLLP